MNHKDKKEIENNVLSPEKADALSGEIADEKKYGKTAEKLVNSAFGTDVFKHEKKSVEKDSPENDAKSEAAKVVKEWKDQPKQVRENIENNLENKATEKEKTEKTKKAALQKDKHDDKKGDKEKSKSVEKQKPSKTAQERQKIINETFKDKKIETKRPIEKVVETKKEKKSDKAIEEEKTKTEILEIARGEFAKVDLMADRYVKLEKKLKMNKTKTDFEKYGGNGGEEYKEAKEKYFKALKARRVEMLEKAIKQIEGGKLPKSKKNKKIKEIIIAEIAKETIVREASRLYDKKRELSLESIGKDSKFEKILNVAKKVVNRYRKMPLKRKLMISAGLFAGGFAAGAVGGATGAALVTGVIAGKWFQRALGGSAAAVGLEGLIKRSQEKKVEKKMSVEFADKLMESIKSGDKKLDEKLLELEGKKKWEKYRRFALAGSIGALIASGWTAKAFGAVIPDEWTDWAKERADLAPDKTPETPVETDASEISETEASTKTASEVSIVSSAGFVEVAEKGDSIWKMAENQLEKHYGEKFSDLSPAQRTYVIDAIKDKIAANPKEFRLDNVDKLKMGQKVDFSGIFESKNNINDIFSKAEGLKQAALENIARNNRILEDWVKEHPGEALTSEKVEEILSGKKSEIKGLTGQDVRIEKEVTNIELGDTPVKTPDAVPGTEEVTNIELGDALTKTPDAASEAGEVINEPLTGRDKEIASLLSGKQGMDNTIEQLKTGKIKPDEFANFYAHNLGASEVSSELQRNIKTNIENLNKPRARVMADRLLRVMFKRILTK